MQWFQWMGIIGSTILLVAFLVFVGETAEKVAERLNKGREKNDLRRSI